MALLVKNTSTKVVASVNRTIDKMIGEIILLEDKISSTIRTSAMKIRNTHKKLKVWTRLENKNIIEEGIKTTIKIDKMILLMGENTKEIMPILRKESTMSKNKIQEATLKK